jgi:hypothetical protein
MSTPVAYVLALLGLLLIMPARADMFPDGSNAKLPTTGTPARAVCTDAAGKMNAQVSGCGIPTNSVVCTGNTTAGSTDNAVLQAAFNAVTAGGEVWLPAGTCTTDAILHVGNGTATSISTITGIRIHGFGGIGPGEFGPPGPGVTYGTHILYTGTANSNAGVLEVDGPIHNIEIDNLLLDANNLAGIGLHVIHAYGSVFRNITTVNWTKYGTALGVVGPLPSGVTQGMMDNDFYGLVNTSPTSTAAIAGLILKGDATNNIGMSRNHFWGGKSIIPDAAGHAGVWLEFADNNTFFSHFTYFSTGLQTGTGHGVQLQPTGGPVGALMPSENTFYNGATLGGIGGTPGTGGTVFWPYPVQDSEALPNVNNVFYMTPQGDAKLHTLALGTVAPFGLPLTGTTLWAGGEITLPNASNINGNLYYQGGFKYVANGKAGLLSLGSVAGNPAIQLQAAVNNTAGFGAPVATMNQVLTADATTISFLGGKMDYGVTNANAWTIQAGGGLFFAGLPAIASVGNYVCGFTSSGQIFFGTGTCTASSLRFKHDVRPIDNPIGRVMGLDAIDFLYNADAGAADYPGRQYGLSAESVAKAAPALVVYDKEGLPERVKYEEAIGLLTAAIQAQQREIDKLKRRVR